MGSDVLLVYWFLQFFSHHCSHPVSLKYFPQKQGELLPFYSLFFLKSGMFCILFFIIISNLTKENVIDSSFPNTFSSSCRPSPGMNLKILLLVLYISGTAEHVPHVNVSFSSIVSLGVPLLSWILLFFHHISALVY